MMENVEQNIDLDCCQSSSVEQKLKRVTEEMNCQRHNAESCKQALEQKLKDQERNSQKVKRRGLVLFVCWAVFSFKRYKEWIILLY